VPELASCRVDSRYDLSRTPPRKTEVRADSAAQITREERGFLVAFHESSIIPGPSFILRQRFIQALAPLGGTLLAARRKATYNHRDSPSQKLQPETRAVLCVRCEPCVQVEIRRETREETLG